MTALSFLTPAIFALREQYPQLSILPVQTPALHLLDRLNTGEVSMSILFHEMIRDRADLSYVLLRRGRMSALVPKTHELAAHPSLNYAVLRSYPLIFHEMSAEQLKMTDMLAELSGHGIDYYACLHEKRAEDILKRVAIGDGIGLMPDGFLCYRMEPLTALPIAGSSLENDVVLDWPSEDTTPAIRAIVHQLEQAAANI